MLAIILVVVIEPSYRQSFFYYSIDYIEVVQQSTSDGGFVFWKILTQSIELSHLAPIMVCLLRYK